MAYVLVDRDGKHNAKVGDFVVTGGGVFEKTPTGSRFISGLDSYIGKGTTKSYSDVVAAFSKASGGGYYQPTQIAPQEVVKPVGVDENGIVSATVDGYDPGDYAVSSSGSGGISNIVGYIVLSLVGIALLDRFMNKGK